MLQNCELEQLKEVSNLLKEGQQRNSFETAVLQSRLEVPEREADGEGNTESKQKKMLEDAKAKHEESIKKAQD